MITIGFYICKTSVSPTFIGDISDCFVSASDCLADHEPQLMLCHGWKPHGDDKAYIKHFASNNDYIKMSAEINKLFEDNLFDRDGRFLRKDDALYFFNEYFNDAEHMIISISSEAVYLPYLEGITILEEQSAGNVLLGNDILGWDHIGTFHSFLCNSLQDEFPDIRFNRYGLIAADFEVVAKMTEKIQGRGEPVDWLPVAVHSLRQSEE